MITLFSLSVLSFVIGAFFYKKYILSYAFGFVGSLAAFILSIVSLNRGINIFSISIAKGLTISLGIDHLTALFMIITSISWMAVSFYSIDYGKLYQQKNLSLGFNITLLGMMIILTARDSFTFLIGWEMMTIFVFVMMLIPGKNYSQAYRFLAFGELSTGCLLIGFAILLNNTSSISLHELVNGGTALLVLISLGFIIKMDIIPFHGWMRAAYENIPDNAAAILSAPVTLMGVYGLERIIPLIPKNETWNLILILFGALSAFWGGLQAVAATKIQILPAYSTIENNGMILTAIGFYAMADGLTDPSLRYLSLFAQAASIIMAISHTFSKTLMFICVGHAKEAYNVNSIDQASGVWSGVGKIPATGIIISALSFGAFPPLIGYAGEWMVLETLFQSYRFPNASTQFFTALAGILTALAIGLIGFAMVKMIGYTALGYDHGRKSRQVSKKFMHITEVALQILIVGCGIAIPAIIIFIGYHSLLTGLLGIPAPLVLASGNPIFGVISPPFIAAIMGGLLIVPILIFVRKQKKVRKVNSWNGGVPLSEEEFFSAPAYSQILEHVLRSLYRTRELKSRTESTIEVEDILVRPVKAVTRFVQKIGEGEALILMNGKISAYVTYILVLFILVFIIGMAVM